jgi:very-short-patch-repair endonuclease
MALAHFPVELAAHVAAHHGIVTLQRLLDGGLSRTQVRRLVTAGVLAAVHRGVYRVATSPATFESACVAACAAQPTVAIGAPCAAWLWGYRTVRMPAQVVALTPSIQPCRLPGVVVRRVHDLQPSDITVRTDGIRLTNPVRTWLDMSATRCSDADLESMLEQLLATWCSEVTLRAAFERWSRQGRPGVARARAVLAHRAGGGPSESHLEHRVVRALVARGVPVVRQHEVVASGRRFRLDVAVPEVRWCAEIDHHLWHAGRNRSGEDKRRDRLLALAGWQTDRVTDDDVRHRFGAAMDELAALYRLRAREFRAIAEAGDPHRGRG